MKNNEDNPVRETGGCGLYLFLMWVCLIGIIITMTCTNRRAKSIPRMVIDGTEILYKNHERAEVVKLTTPAPGILDSTKIDYFPNGF